jgi:DNA-binding NtrC family response regulator
LTRENFDEVLLGRVDRSRPGRISQAAGGTLLLLRVDKLEPSLGERLERIAAEITAGRLGGRCRVISTSVHSPEDLVRREGFSPRLGEILGERVVRIPMLRERVEDIPVLVRQFLREASEEFDRAIESIDDEAMESLLSYSWPGNVKELKILVEHVVMTAPGKSITVGDLLIPRKSCGTQRAAGESPGPGGARVEVLREGSAGADSRSRPEEMSAAEEFVGDPAGGLRYQKSLRGRVVVYGQGLHSGVKTGLTLSPMPPGSGILFGHITSGGSVPALIQNVKSTEFSTCLMGNAASASTI